MTPEIRIIHQLTINEIFEISVKTESDLKAWLANGQYLLSRPLKPNNKNHAAEFELILQYPKILYASLANDCNRFSLAAIESMWSVKKIIKLPKSTGWAAVQMYYSAFFAVHAILRLFGRACTQLENSHVQKVYQIAVATQDDGGVTRIENGFYLSCLDNGVLKCNKLKDSHADTWSSFYNLLTWIIDNIITTTGIGEHKSDAISLISDLKTAISCSGATRGNWLSVIRNKVNYQHSYGVWYPYKGALHNHNAVIKNTEWLKEPKTFDLSETKNEITALFNISNAVLSLMYHLMKYGYERAGNISIPLKNGTFRLINQIMTA
jgi:hypothetical protein